MSRGRERRAADLFLADLLGAANAAEDASGAIDGEDQPPTYDLQFIDQRLGGVTPAGAHCAVICPHRLTPARGELDMILYLHGWKATCSSDKDDPADPSMREMLGHRFFKSIPPTIGDSGKNVVFVAPTLGEKGQMGPGPYKRFLAAEPWSLLNAALAQVQKGFRQTLKHGKLILAGHSGAGPHILALLNRGDAELSRVFAVWALDSFYGGETVDDRATLWRNAIKTNRGITWTIVPSTGSDVNETGIAIEAEQKSKRLANQRYLDPGASHCAVPAKALGQLLRDESRLTTRPPAPAPPAPRSPSESFYESLRAGSERR